MCSSKENPSIFLGFSFPQEVDKTSQLWNRFLKAFKVRCLDQQGYLHTDHNDQRCGHGNCEGLVVGNVLPVLSNHIVKGPIGDEEKG